MHDNNYGTLYMFFDKTYGVMLDRSLDRRRKRVYFKRGTAISALKNHIRMWNKNPENKNFQKDISEYYIVEYDVSKIETINEK